MGSAHRGLQGPSPAGRILLTVSSHQPALFLLGAHTPRGNFGRLALSMLACFLRPSPALLSTRCCCWRQEGHWTGGSEVGLGAHKSPGVRWTAAAGSCLWEFAQTWSLRSASEPLEVLGAGAWRWRVVVFKTVVESAPLSNVQYGQGPGIGTFQQSPLPPTQ